MDRDDEQDEERKKISSLACKTWKVKFKSDEITLSMASLLI